MSIPGLRLKTLQLNDYEKLVDEFFTLDREDREPILAWYNGHNFDTGKPIKIGKRIWKTLGHDRGWNKYLTLLNHIDTAIETNDKLILMKREMNNINDELIAKYGEQFREAMDAILALGEGENYTFTVNNRTYTAVPKLKLGDCDFNKTHICPGCKLIFNPKNFNPYYCVSSNCGCDLDEAFEFNWDIWQPS
jgi:hypothetical protein